MALKVPPIMYVEAPKLPAAEPAEAAVRALASAASSLLKTVAFVAASLIWFAWFLAPLTSFISETGLSAESSRSIERIGSRLTPTLAAVAPALTPALMLAATAAPPAAPPCRQIQYVNDERRPRITNHEIEDGAQQPGYGVQVVLSWSA